MPNTCVGKWPFTNRCDIVQSTANGLTWSKSLGWGIEPFPFPFTSPDSDQDSYEEESDSFKEGMEEELRDVGQAPLRFGLSSLHKKEIPVTPRKGVLGEGDERLPFPSSP